MNRLKKEKELAIVSALVEGVSIRSIERMTGVHRDTILRLLNRVGERCNDLLHVQMRGLPCRLLQVDEIWTFCKKKEQHLTEAEHLNPELGDQYVFLALDADTKLVPTFFIGKRDSDTAHLFIDDLKERLANRVQLTTDGFRAYLTAVESAFGSEIDYAQLVKLYGAENPGPGRYSPPRVTEVVSTPINGNPDPRFISTSYVERQNLTMRMQMRRFTRLTNAFSKSLRNLKDALALHFAHYNFVRIHGSLRVTPAMAAGIADSVWALDRLLAADEVFA